ncbi:MAG: SDR family NAD(P)-dependent oxidoreductase [Polyangiaceae bacterium]|nr:SDR family NAD(P)-dependent oxidoreductase [Polyangiaceae bacterium]
MKADGSHDAERAVLVTGASSGIGHAIATRLAGSGFHVFAGVRNARDGAALREVHAALEPVIVDVTKPEQIAAAAEHLGRAVGEQGLFGLVNNAGIGVSGPLELLPLDELRWQFEVNVFGQIAVTQALLPLLRRAKGRIVNIGSVGDRITIPFAGALTASKHAFASLNDAMRMELHAWGIHVALVEPGAIVTKAVDKLELDAEKTIAGFTEEGRSLYGETYRAAVKRAAEHERQGSPPDVVAQAVERALAARKPRTRYLVGHSARPLALMAKTLPDTLLDRVRFAITGLPPKFGSRAG